MRNLLNSKRKMQSKMYRMIRMASRRLTLRQMLRMQRINSVKPIQSRNTNLRLPPWKRKRSRKRSKKPKRRRKKPKKRSRKQRSMKKLQKLRAIRRQRRKPTLKQNLQKRRQKSPRQSAKSTKRRLRRPMKKSPRTHPSSQLSKKERRIRQTLSRSPSNWPLSKKRGKRSPQRKSRMQEMSWTTQRQTRKLLKTILTKLKSNKVRQRFKRITKLKRKPSTTWRQQNWIKKRLQKTRKRPAITFFMNNRSKRKKMIKSRRKRGMPLLVVSRSMVKTRRINATAQRVEVTLPAAATLPAARMAQHLIPIAPSLQMVLLQMALLPETEQLPTTLQL